MAEGKKKEEKGIAEIFLGEIPVMGDFFRALAKTDAFKEKLKEVNKQIEENLKKGHKKKISFEADISVRPLFKEAPYLIKEPKKEATEIKIGEEYFYGKKDNKLTLVVKVPNENVDLSIRGKNLLIKSDTWQRNIELPDHFHHIKKKQYKNGYWLLELTK